MGKGRVRDRTGRDRELDNMNQKDPAAMNRINEQRANKYDFSTHNKSKISSKIFYFFIFYL